MRNRGTDRNVCIFTIRPHNAVSAAQHENKNKKRKSSERESNETAHKNMLLVTNFYAFPMFTFIASPKQHELLCDALPLSPISSPQLSSLFFCTLIINEFDTNSARRENRIKIKAFEHHVKGCTGGCLRCSRDKKVWLWHHAVFFPCRFIE